MRKLLQILECWLNPAEKTPEAVVDNESPVVLSVSVSCKECGSEMESYSGVFYDTQTKEHIFRTKCINPKCEYIDEVRGKEQHST